MSAARPEVERSTLDELAALLLERAGLRVTPHGYYGLRLALADRMPALGLSDAREYVSRLKEVTGEHELRALLPLVTVGKTEFFRDPRQFEALQWNLLPDILAAAQREGRVATAWSAGCATGEEAYSLAILAAELGATPNQLGIWATDLNQAALEKAKLGRYPLRRMSGVDDTRRNRFFVPAAGGYEVRPRLRELITFEGLNLAAPVFPRVQPASVDLILCRNVIIYFDLPTIRSLMERFLQALRPGGVLLLGYSESLFRVYDHFEMFEVRGSFAYRRPLSPRVVKTATPPAVDPMRWAFRSQAKAPRQRPSEPERLGPGGLLDQAERSMEQGDFASALSSLDQLANRFPDHLETTLMRGNVLALMGRVEEALETFRQVLQLEPLCVEARVFGGVAALQAGQLQLARQEFSRALFLEPALALGHYLLGGVQERLGEVAAAARSYRNVLSHVRHSQRPLAGRYPDLPESTEAVARAAQCALSALAESGRE